MARKKKIKVDDFIIIQGRDIIAARIRSAQRKFNKLNKAVQKKIMNKLEKEKYIFTKAVADVIDKQFALLNTRIDAVTSTLEKEITKVSQNTIRKAAKNRVKITLSKAQAAFITRNVNTDLFSKFIHQNHALVKEELISSLKKSLKDGDSILKIANNLQGIDDIKVDLPAYIKEITAAARKAAKDPKQRKNLIKVIKKYKGKIGALKAGKLGIKTITNKFVKEIQTANLKNIDSVVSKWAEGKALYMQTRVARTESLRIYSDMHRQNAIEAPYIIGIEIRTAHRHDPAKDNYICETIAGIYLFADYAIEDIPTIPGSTHPNCICSQFNVYDENTASKLLSNEEIEELFQEAA